MFAENSPRARLQNVIERLRANSGDDLAHRVLDEVEGMMRRVAESDPKELWGDMDLATIQRMLDCGVSIDDIKTVTNQATNSGMHLALAAVLESHVGPEPGVFAEIRGMLSDD